MLYRKHVMHLHVSKLQQITNFNYLRYLLTNDPMNKCCSHDIHVKLCGKHVIIHYFQIVRCEVFSSCISKATYILEWTYTFFLPKSMWFHVMFEIVKLPLKMILISPPPPASLGLYKNDFILDTTWTNRLPGAPHLFLYIHVVYSLATPWHRKTSTWYLIVPLWICFN